jgi:hypothetical protein
MTLVIADILTEFGTVYRDGGQDATRLLRRPFIPSLTEALFGLLPTDDTSYQMAKTELGRILQPFQKGWTPLGTLTATPITLNQFPLKVDLEETPDVLETSWLGFLADKNLDRAQWPVIRYLVEQHVYSQLDEDYELNEIYFGKYAAPTTGTPGAAGTSIDGIRILINRAIAAGKITPMVLGAIPTDIVDFCNYVEAFVEGFSARYANKGMEICMNITLARRYAKGRQKKYGSDNNYTAPKPLLDGLGNELVRIPVEFSNHVVVGLPSMGASAKIWATPAENRKRLTKKTVNTKQVRIESAKRSVAIYTDFYKGVGFPLLEAVFTNDQDTTTT